VTLRKDVEFALPGVREPIEIGGRAFDVLMTLLTTSHFAGYQLGQQSGRQIIL
jgi:hypothetical protein